MKQHVELQDGARVVTAVCDGDSVVVAGTDRTHRIRADADGRLQISGPAGDLTGIAALGPGTVWVQINGHVIEFRVDAAAGAQRAAHGHERLTPPMSATVVTIAVSAGERVQAGQTLVVVEAMKMELPIRAPHDGVVQAIHCRVGELVQPDQVLVDLSI